MYEERTWAPWCLLALLWGACLAGALAAATEMVPSAMAPAAGTAGGAAAEAARPWRLALEDPRTTVALVLLFPLVVTLVFMRLDVRVGPKAIRIAFGPVHIVRRTVPLAQLTSAEPVTYRPIRDFGGWGVRFRGRRGSAWTIRGNRAVKLTLDIGGKSKLLYVGSQTPERLAARINAVLLP